MSVLSTIKADVTTFFHDLTTAAGKFASAFTKLFGKAPAAIQLIENFTSMVAPVITVAVSMVDPLAEPEVAAVLSRFETGLAAVQASATSANSGQSLLQNLENFAATVPQLLTGVAIKDAALQGKITKIVNLVTGEAKVLIPAVQSWVKQIEGAPVAG